MLRLGSESVRVFASYRLGFEINEPCIPVLDMLTYLFYLLSKPSSPIDARTAMTCPPACLYAESCGKGTDICPLIDGLPTLFCRYRFRETPSSEAGIENGSVISVFLWKTGRESIMRDESLGCCQGACCPIDASGGTDSMGGMPSSIAGRYEERVGWGNL